MDNENIKEILDNLKFTNNDVMWCDKITLDVEQSHLLLDYITNLQTIEREYSAILSENAELQQENERLKEQVNENKIIVEYAIKPSFTTRKLKDYKDGLEKALQQIEQLTNNWNELEEIIRKDHEECKNICDNFERSVTIYTKTLLDKMNEIKGDNNE